MSSLDSDTLVMSASSCSLEPPPPGTEDLDLEGFPGVVPPAAEQQQQPQVSTDSTGVEHEEGEIEDDDEPEYENISSDEEFTTIRERIAQLQAMDTEMGRLNEITGRNGGSGGDQQRSYAYGKRTPPVIVSEKDKENNYECISEDEDLELYLRQFESVPKPKPLPTGRRRSSRPLRGTTSGTTPLALRSTASYKSSKSRHRRTAAPSSSTNAAALGKRRHDTNSSSSSARKTLHRRHKRRKTHAATLPPMVNISDSDTNSEGDFPLDRARLQAACSISTRKRKTDKENWDSLKRKLRLQMRQKRGQKEREEQPVVDVVEKEVEIVSDEPMVLVDDDDDDEEEEDEEVLQLRLQALKTKAELKETTDVVSLLDEETPAVVEEPPVEMAPEEQELRMIALQSAFTKKHQIRLKKRQEERPYSPSDEIQLLSPVNETVPMFVTPTAAEVVDVDEDIQMIVTRPETVEIADSSDEDESRMEISPSASPTATGYSEQPNTTLVDMDLVVCSQPEPPNIQPIDMELASSGDSQSPAPIAQANEQSAPLKEHLPELDSPVSQTDDLQSKFPEEDDEESLRNHLLLNLSACVPAAPPPRPLTPDSTGEEETEALRELLLSKMNNKKVPKTSQEPPPETIHSDEVLVPQEDTLPTKSPAVAVASRVPTNPNLITLIGKQKIARKKRKRLNSKAATTIVATAQQSVELNLLPVAIAAKRPTRSLVKTPVARVAAPPTVPQVIQPPMRTTKVLVNPNKLINLNHQVSTVVRQQPPKDRSAILENYVQKPVPKLVIQLGQSESDSDPDYYPTEPDHPQPAEPHEERLRDALLRDLDNASPSRVTLESPTYSPIPEATAQDSDSIPEAPAAAPNAAFEQRLDQFLRTVRSQTDQTKSVPTAPSVGSGPNGVGTAVRKQTASLPAPTPLPTTPSAVRHLPKSAQLEYKQLLVRMAQLEKQKQQRSSIIIQKRTCPEKPPAQILTKTIVNNGPAEAASEANKNHEIVVTVNHDRRDVVDRSNAPAPTAPVVPPRRDTDTLVKRVLLNNTVIAGTRTALQQQVVQAPIVAAAAEPIETKDNPPPIEQLIAAPATQPPPEVAQKTPTKTVRFSSTRKDKSADRELTSLREALRRLTTIKENDRSRVLEIAEKRYEDHSERFSQQLQDLIATVGNAQLERQKQYDLENKVAYMREKLMVLERALSVHKSRVTAIFPALHASHTRVMTSRKKSIELNNLCQSIGREVQGDSYSPPSRLRTDIHNQLKVLTHETKVLKNMKKLSLEEFKAHTAQQRRLLQAAEARAPVPVQQVDAGSQPGPSKAPPAEIEEQKEIQADVKAEAIAPNPTNVGSLSVVDMIIQQHTRSAPASRSASPLIDQEVVGSSRQPPLAQEAPAILTSEAPRMRFEKYTSPLASLQQNQSALNIPDGVICPYQMRGECVDKDCKFEHL